MSFSPPSNLPRLAPSQVGQTCGPLLLQPYPGWRHHKWVKPVVLSSFNPTQVGATTSGSNLWSSPPSTLPKLEPLQVGQTCGPLSSFNPTQVRATTIGSNMSSPPSTLPRLNPILHKWVKHVVLPSFNPTQVRSYPPHRGQACLRPPLLQPYPPRLEPPHGG